MSNDPHFSFVVAAYGFGFFVLAGMILLILLDYWNLKQALSRFAARSSREGSE
jgi:heme exporter protein D